MRKNRALLFNEIKKMRNPEDFASAHTYLFFCEECTKQFLRPNVTQDLEDVVDWVEQLFRRV